MDWKGFAEEVKGPWRRWEACLLVLLYGVDVFVSLRDVFVGSCTYIPLHVSRESIRVHFYKACL